MIFGQQLTTIMSPSLNGLLPQFNISDHTNRVPQKHSNAIFPEEIFLPEFLAKYRNNNESENSYTWRKRTASTPNKSVIIICVYLSVLFCPS